MCSFLCVVFMLLALEMETGYSHPQSVSKSPINEIHHTKTPSIIKDLSKKNKDSATSYSIDSETVKRRQKIEAVEFTTPKIPGNSISGKIDRTRERFLGSMILPIKISELFFKIPQLIHLVEPGIDLVDTMVNACVNLASARKVDDRDAVNTTKSGSNRIAHGIKGRGLLSLPIKISELFSQIPKLFNMVKPRIDSLDTTVHLSVNLAPAIKVLDRDVVKNTKTTNSSSEKNVLGTGRRSLGLMNVTAVPIKISELFFKVPRLFIMVKPEFIKHNLSDTAVDVSVDLASTRKVLDRNVQKTTIANSSPGKPGRRGQESIIFSKRATNGLSSEESIRLPIKISELFNKIPQLFNMVKPSIDLLDKFVNLSVNLAPAIKVHDPSAKSSPISLALKEDNSSTVLAPKVNKSA